MDSSQREKPPAFSRMQSFIVTGPLEEIEELAELLDMDEPRNCSEKQKSAVVAPSKRLLPVPRVKTRFDSGDYFVQREFDERLEKYQKDYFKVQPSNGPEFDCDKKSTEAANSQSQHSTVESSPKSFSTRESHS